MRKLASRETRLLALIAAAGGSICPGTDASIPRAAHRILRRLVARGDLMDEETDDGPRFHLTIQGQWEIDHGL